MRSRHSHPTSEQWRVLFGRRRRGTTGRLGEEVAPLLHQVETLVRSEKVAVVTFWRKIKVDSFDYFFLITSWVVSFAYFKKHL